MCEYLKEARKAKIEEVLKDCNYENACRPYLEGVEIKAEATRVPHKFCCGETDERLKSINITVDFKDHVLQEFSGSMEELEIEMLGVIKEIVDSYVSVCIEN